MAQMAPGPRLYPHPHFPHEPLDKSPAMAEMVAAELELFAPVHLKEAHQRPDPVGRREMVYRFVSLAGKRLDFARIDWVAVLVVEI